MVLIRLSKLCTLRFLKQFKKVLNFTMKKGCYLILRKSIISMGCLVPHKPNRTSQPASHLSIQLAFLLASHLASQPVRQPACQALWTGIQRAKRKKKQQQWADASYLFNLLGKIQGSTSLLHIHNNIIIRLDRQPHYYVANNKHAGTYLYLKHVNTYKHTKGNT